MAEEKKNDEIIQSEQPLKKENTENEKDIEIEEEFEEGSINDFIEEESNEEDEITE